MKALGALHGIVMSWRLQLHRSKPKALLLLQVGGGGHRGGPEHASGSAHGPGALRRAGPKEMAVRRVVQRRDAGQHDGGGRSAWVSSIAVSYSSACTD